MKRGEVAVEIAVIIIVIVVVGCLVIGGIANQSERDALEAQARAAEADALLNPPPTDRQLNFIDALIVERETEDWMLEDPQTVQEASDLIDTLLEQPYRDRADTDC